MLKHTLRDSRLTGLACWLASLYIRLVYATGRWRHLGTETRDRMAAADAPFVVCFWHGRMLMMPYAWHRCDQVHTLISAHADGQLIARMVGHFGAKTIAGSTSKGGGEAIRAMLKVLRNREWVAITPDGPRGPRMRASAGIITVARMAGVPILPLTFSVDRSRTLGSWDRFCAPLPFGRGVFIWGSPIEVAPDADEAAQELARRRVEDELNRITAEADRLCDRPAVEPAPPRPADKERLGAAG